MNKRRKSISTIIIILVIAVIGTIGVGFLLRQFKPKEEQKTATVNLDNLKKAEKHITRLFESEEYKEASSEEKLELAVETVDKLVEEDVVVKETVTVLEDIGVVTYQYVGGGAATIETKPIEVPTEIITPTVSTTEIEKPDNFTLRIYNAFENNDYRNSNYQKVLNNLKQNGVNMDLVVYDDEVMVEELLEISNYSMVSFSMHGTYCRINANTIAPVMVLLDDKGTDTREKELEKYIANYEIIQAFGSDGMSFGVTPLFFINNMSENSLANTIIYSETCCFLGRCNDTQCDRAKEIYCKTGSTFFVDAFCNLGSPAVAGFHNSVMANYAINGLTYFANAMYGGYTPKMAYEAFTDEKNFGPTDWNYRKNSSYSSKPSAYLMLYGNNITITAADMIKSEEPEITPEPETKVPTEEPEKPSDSEIMEDALVQAFLAEGSSDFRDAAFAAPLIEIMGTTGSRDVAVYLFEDPLMVAAYGLYSKEDAENLMKNIYAYITGGDSLQVDKNTAYYAIDRNQYVYTMEMDEILITVNSVEKLIYRVMVIADYYQFYK